MLETIWTKFISCHHNDHLVGHFGIEKKQELVARKYSQPILQYNAEAYVKGCNV